MIKESKYILCRILIGVGIVLVLGFLRSNKVNALSWNDSDMVEIVPSFRVRVSDSNSYKIYYNSTENRYYLYSTKAPNDYSLYIENASDYPYIVSNMGKDSSPFVGSNGWASGRVHFYNKIPYYLWPGDLTPTPSDTSTRYFVSDENEVIDKDFLVYNDSYNFSNNRTESSTFTKQTYSQWNNMSITRMWQLQKNSIIFSNFDMFNYVSHDLYYQKNINWSPVVKIITLNPIKFKTLNNIIFRYFFSPEFTSWDTSNYVYQYKFGDGTTWLNLTQNNQLLQVNNNGTIYVRVKNINTDEVVDSQTYTITDIGTFATEQNYNIEFSGEYRTSDYLNNNVSKSQSIIKEYQIYVSYLPKASILKYQYQYITSGTCNDVQTWQQVASADNGSFTYVASQNGTLCARILDSSDTVQYEDSFEVSTIGDLALNNNSSKLYNFFDSIRNKVDFGGPIGSLVNIPITLLQTLSNGFTGATGVCTDYNLGNLWGTNLKLPCVNVKQHLGNQLYTIIDVICACCMFYMMVKMLTNAYFKFLLMEHTPVQEHIGRDY